MWVIETDSQYCKDCYKCLKYCPVKAIKFEDSISKIVDERCILCGNCIRVCPQEAKKDVSYINEIKELLKSNKTVIASIAPSFAAYFDKIDYRQLIAILKKLGFKYVEETAIGAYYVAQSTKEEIKDRDFTIGTSCPASVYLIEKYYPQYIPFLSKAVSPIIAHARDIKKVYGEDVSIVFISPCVAKKREVMEEQFEGLIDYPISFKELNEWIEEDKIPNEKETISFDRTSPGFSPLFPIEGGLLKTANMESDYTSLTYMSITGADNIMSFLDNYSQEDFPSLKFVDFMMCEGGCINGPLSWKEANPLNKIKVLKYHETKEKQSANTFVSPSVLDRHYEDLHKEYPMPSEEEISYILKNIGKTTKQDELNCGACGYPTCREKAIAVYQNMAEPQMCLPYMRSKAESLANLIIENTPNGIVILNKNKRIISVNPAFKKIFKTNETDLTAKSIKEFLPTDIFKENDINTYTYKTDNPYTVLKIISFPVTKEGVIIGIIQNITEEEKQKEEMANIRKEIAEKTNAVITKQMRIAQEIAGLLGETTAETKTLLLKLSKILSEDNRVDN